MLVVGREVDLGEPLQEVIKVVQMVVVIVEFL